MENHIHISEYNCLAGIIMLLSPPKIRTVGYKPNRITTSRACAYRLKMLCLVCCVFMVISGTKAQEAEYTIQANIIYHFTKYINWPDDKKSGDFIIGIVGDTPMYDELKVFMASKTAGRRKIVIKKISTSDKFFECHILFISEDESGRLKKIMAIIKNAPTLLVSESEELAEKGSCINFVLINDRLKLEINKSSIEQRGLGIATELLSLGKIVK